MGQNQRKQKLEYNQWSRWYLVPEKNSAGEAVQKIRRYRIIDSKTKWERYPSKNYRDMSQIEIDSLLIRLNATFQIDKRSAEERYVFDHSYINLKSMAAFEKQLDKNISDSNARSSVLQMLNEYVFEFFVIQNKLPDPSRWHLKENEWGDWLLLQDLSPATLRKIVGTANRFNKFLIDKMYSEMATPRKLEPIGKLKLDKIDVERRKRHGSKYIKAETYENMIKTAKAECPEILPNMILCYSFGLRISESLGLTKEKFLKDSLLVDEQGDRIASRKVTKTLERRIPYWNMSAKEAWLLVKEIKVMHPDTLNRRVNLFLGKFGHTSHDFRRAFITNSLRKFHWKDVQKAVGHTDVRTTMSYDQDDRNLSNEKADLD